MNSLEKQHEVEIITSRETLSEAIALELEDYFSDARVTGIGIHGINSDWIIGGILRRVSGPGGAV